jgi:mono/diheme cytochrome c family protein
VGTSISLDALKENYMKWIFGRTAMWIWATLALATMAFAAVQDPQLPDGDGKKILETACTSCHGLDGVVKLHMDKEGWEGLVSSMVSNGAQVDSKDFPVLINYLVKNFGNAKPADQPAQSASGGDDAAKKILADSCTACHDLDLVSGQRGRQGSSGSCELPGKDLRSGSEVGAYQVIGGLVWERIPLLVIVRGGREIFP